MKSQNLNKNNRRQNLQIHPNKNNFCPKKKKKKKKPYSKTKHCQSFLTEKHQANPISRLLLSSQEEANEVRHKQFLHVPVTDRFAILQNS